VSKPIFPRNLGELFWKKERGGVGKGEKYKAQENNYGQIISYRFLRKSLEKQDRRVVFG